MYSLSREEYDRNKSTLFRHYVDPYHATSGIKEDDRRNVKKPNGDSQIVQTQFINAYFNRFIKTGGETDDHFDLAHTQFDSFGIPQDMSKRYFAMSQLTDFAVPSSLGHIPVWLVRHFQYVVQLSLDFLNELKFKKLRDLRKLQKDLPIYERKKEILDLVEKHQVLIIAGDTGCGKSTQVPQYLLEAGYSGVACTQPRRIACTALARRVAYETLNTYGSQIIILDEVHERHLTSDLLVGLLRDLTHKRSDIKLILMSATINLELFSSYFSEAPVVQVPGRLFPIKLVYRPIKILLAEQEKKNYKIDPQPFVQVLELIDKEVPSNERGDALIFLNGVAEITKVAESLKTYAEVSKGWIILVLHSMLSVEEQDKVFDVAPAGVRKCILSTNIAETSVTIDGIRFVIDSGKVNHIKYDASTGTQKLSEFWVSKASANQRKGRAGRTGPGICYRLYSTEQFDKFEDFTQSEINRVSLQEIVLRILSLNLALDPKEFPFIEKPSEEALNEAIQTLKFHGIVHPDKPNELTSLGATIARIPVDVSIAKMLVLGCISNQIEVILTIAAALSIQSPFTSRSFRELEVVKRRESLTSRLGDPFTLVNVFREWVEVKIGGTAARRWTHENGIDEHRLYEISKLRHQYRRVLEDAELIKPLHDNSMEDSRQRRMDAGDKKKLYDMKREARNKDKQRKVLRADKHFDELFTPENEEDDEANPITTDVNTVEFLLSHKHADVDRILKTHKLRSKDIQIIRVIISVGLYPKFALLDPLNKYKQGQELFVHTRMKPFSQIHPNSAVAQYHSQTLDSGADNQNISSHHQLLSFGLLLETTKPYICNVLPIPILVILLAAKKVVCPNWESIFIDDFLEITFKRERDCRNVIRQVIEIRQEIHRELLNQGFFDPDGQVEIEIEEDIGDINLEDNESVVMCESSEALASTDASIKEEKFNNEAKKEENAAKSSYYSILLKRQSEREKNEPADKRPRDKKE